MRQYILYWDVVQLVERLTLNQEVESSNLSIPTKFLLEAGAWGRYPPAGPIPAGL